MRIIGRNWEEKWSEEFEWSREQPSPEDVAQEAKESCFESISDLISKMEEASSTCSTGFEKWKWFRNWGCAFGMNKTSESDS